MSDDASATSAPTERSNSATRGLDRLESGELVAVLLREQRRAPEVVARAATALACAVDAVAARLREGGRLHYVGAGTSGRLGVLDAAECPPTFGTPPEFVQAHLAGGADALVRAVEGAEDDAEAGGRIAREHVRAGDAVVGVSASGRAPYVVAALRTARNVGALTIALTADPDAPLVREAELTIVLDSGAEAIAGSTRLLAGTVQKIALGTFSTALMVRLGKVYDNLMVDVVATNAKLRKRALELVRSLASVDTTEAAELLRAAEGSVKVAVVMARCGLDARAARARLTGADGRLREVLEAADADLPSSAAPQ